MFKSDLHPLFRLHHVLKVFIHCFALSCLESLHPLMCSIMFRKPLSIVLLHKVLESFIHCFTPSCLQNLHSLFCSIMSWNPSFIILLHHVLKTFIHCFISSCLQTPSWGLIHCFAPSYFEILHPLFYSIMFWTPSWGLHPLFCSIMFWNPSSIVLLHNVLKSSSVVLLHHVLKVFIYWFDPSYFWSLHTLFCFILLLKVIFYYFALSWFWMS